MRAVALSDASVQKNINASFVPLKFVIDPQSKEFAVDWPALEGWCGAYRKMAGNGFTGCSIVSPDLAVEYANTGSGFVWEMFDSTCYDPAKFNAMLDRGLERAAREREIGDDPKLCAEEKERQQASFRAEMRKAVSREGQLHLPRKGFTSAHAIELFTISGDLPKKE